MVCRLRELLPILRFGIVILLGYRRRTNKRLVNSFKIHLMVNKLNRRENGSDLSELQF